LKSANTTPTSAWSSDLFPKAPKRLCMDFMATICDCMQRAWRGLMNKEEELAGSKAEMTFG
jgi:hypothetical protein